jgi:hypothetical protein
MDPIDIRRAAARLLEDHGSGAVDRALAHLREHCAAGDLEGCATWSRMLAELNRMELVERRPRAER